MSHYLVFDSMVLVHQLSHAIGAGREVEPYDMVAFLSHPYLYIHPDNPIGLNPIGAKIIWVMDEKNEAGKYWRHEYLPQYKSGRKEKKAMIRFVRDSLLKLLAKHEIPVLLESGYEADDWAGFLVNQLKPDDKMALITVDSDWAQLVSDQVMWLDTFPPMMRKGESQKCPVLGVDEVVSRINGHRLSKAHCKIKKPRDIVGMKHLMGDSDNIPPGRIVDIGIIDLINPTVCLDSPFKLSDLKPIKPLPISPQLKCSDLGLPDWYKFGRDGTTQETTNEPTT